MDECVTLVIPNSQFRNNCNKDLIYSYCYLSFGPRRKKTFLAKGIRGGSHVCGRHYV
jgi:hypothetical protein